MNGVTRFSGFSQNSAHQRLRTLHRHALRSGRGEAASVAKALDGTQKRLQALRTHAACEASLTGGFFKMVEAKKPNALQKPLKPSPDLAAVIGDGTVTRGEMVSKIWTYIKANNLQNPANKREIVADAKLKVIFGKDKVTMFEMNKHLSKHLS
jgi:upstream activation factor subunit UAF30